MSWQQLISIIDDTAAEAAVMAATPPIACPNDGEPLSTGPNGELFCRWDGWRAEGSRS